MVLVVPVAAGHLRHQRDEMKGATPRGQRWDQCQEPPHPWEHWELCGSHIMITVM